LLLFFKKEVLPFILLPTILIYLQGHSPLVYVTWRSGGQGMAAIGRRAVLAAGLGMAGRASADVKLPAGNVLAFRMIRHGGEIGKHVVTFVPQGDALTVHVTVDALVTLLAIPIVRYTHRATESWQGGTLVGLTGTTTKNSEHEWVSASRAGDSLVVTGSKTARYVAPASAIPTSYWNKHMLSGPMISLEDGVLLRPDVTQHPTEPLKVASGGSIPAEHFSLRGAFDVDLWYDRTDTWASLAYTAMDRSTVHYERL
jgi:hypothetical protein